jgi:hypothetical protein
MLAAYANNLLARIPRINLRMMAGFSGRKAFPVQPFLLSNFQICLWTTPGTTISRWDEVALNNLVLGSVGGEENLDWLSS